MRGGIAVATGRWWGGGPWTAAGWLAEHLRPRRWHSGQRREQHPRRCWRRCLWLWHRRLRWSWGWSRCYWGNYRRWSRWWCRRWRRRSVRWTGSSGPRVARLAPRRPHPYQGTLAVEGTSRYALRWLIRPFYAIRTNTDTRKHNTKTTVMDQRQAEHINSN